MSNDKNLIINTFKYENEKELKSFFKSLFYADKDSYDFESDFVKHIYDRNGINSNFNIPFNKQQIEDYLCHCFDNDSKLIKGIDDRFWHCYRLCFIKDYIQQSSNSWQPISKILEQNKEKLLYEIIPKYLTEFLLFCVKPQDWYGEDANSLKVGLQNDSPMKLFGSFKNLIDYLESEKLKEKLKKSPEFLDEFLIFAKEVDKTKQFINFNFTFPPVLVKLENAKNKMHLV